MIGKPPPLLERRASAVRRRRLLVALGVSILALFLVVELLLFRSYQETERTTRDFSTTTDATTAIANIQRETLLLDRDAALLAAGRGGRQTRDDLELRRGLVGRQLDVLNGAASRGRELPSRVRAIHSTLSRLDRALRAGASRDRGASGGVSREVSEALVVLERQVKEVFDEQEHALYAALTQTLHDRANGQRFVVGLSALTLLLELVLAAAIWRAVRRDFSRAYAALAAEAAERETLQEQLWHQATHDPLTGLGNRVQFQRELAETRSARTGRVAILYLDLDGFKNVNDTLGHDAGDELLCEVARRIAACVRANDRFARLGGDEFAVLLRGIRSDDDAIGVAESLRAAVSAPCHLEGREVRVGACVGVALTDARACEAEELIASADLAMYAAKRAGKGAVRLYDEAMRADALARAELEVELRAAIDRDELELHYQPIVDLAGEALVGLEALVRWRHPERGLIAPGEFLPTAEQAGLIAPIDRWVLHQACRDAEGWQALTPDRRAPWVSVNIGPEHVEDASLIEDVSGALGDSGLEPERLLLEISERARLTTGRQTPGARLARLHELGVRMAVDDFGTGQTSLSSLRFLPISILKLDKSLVDEIATDGERERIAAAMLDVADTLGLETIAEGIEDPEQLAGLAGLGCEMGQGFHFSRPVPPHLVSGLLEWAPRVTGAEAEA